MLFHHQIVAPHQWRSDSALKAGRWEVPGSIPSRACRLSQLKFSHGLFQNSGKYGLGSLRKTPTEGNLPIVPRPTNGQLDSYLHSSIHLSQYFNITSIMPKYKQKIRFILEIFPMKCQYRRNIGFIWKYFL